MDKEYDFSLPKDLEDQLNKLPDHFKDLSYKIMREQSQWFDAQLQAIISETYGTFDWELEQAIKDFSIEVHKGIPEKKYVLYKGTKISEILLPPIVF